MALWDWLGGLVQSDAHRPTHVKVSPQNVSGTARPGDALVAGQHYLRIWVSELVLEKSKEWFSKRTPNVHCLTRLQYGDSTVELANVAGKNRLDVGAFNADRAVLKNYAMTGLLPFRGGAVDLDAGLMSMSNGDEIERFAAVVGDFAEKLTGPQVSAAIGMASSIATGVQELLGAGKAAPKLYFRDTFTGVGGGSPLTSGFIFLSSAPAGSIKPEHVWVFGDEVRIGATAAAAKPVTGQDYMLLRVERLVARDDWQQLKSIAEPFDEAIALKMENKLDEAKLALNRAKIAAHRSQDLTPVDRKRVMAAMDKEFQDTPSGLAVRGAAPPSLASEMVGRLEAAMRKAPGLEEAARLPELTEAELLVR